MTTNEQEYQKDRYKLNRKLPILIILVGFLILAIWTVSIAVPVWGAARSLLDKQSSLEELAAEGVLNADPEEAEELIQGVRADVKVLDEKLSPILPIVSKFEFIPRIGPLLAASPELMIMASDGTEAAYSAYTGLKPGLALLNDDSLDGQTKIRELLVVLDEAKPEIMAASESFDRVVEAREKIENESKLPWRVRNLLDLFDENLSLVRGGFTLAPVIPEIMALNDQKKYLIIAQNEDELRATGGFISGAGLLVLKDGRIDSLEFEDANTVDDWQNKPYDFPPQPLTDFMGTQLLFFRDANYWPDFQQTAMKAMDLYSYGKDVALDGAIAIDQQFLRNLLVITGPLFVSELEKLVSSDNVIEEIRDAWEPESDQDQAWWQSRKDFMGVLAGNLMAKIMDDFQSLDPIYVARTLFSAADERHIQIYLEDQEINSIITEIGWASGQIQDDTFDYLQVIDSNVGFNKVNAVIDRDLNYTVEFLDDGHIESTLEVSYIHHGYKDEGECDHGVPNYSSATTYDSLLNDCYWNYLRIYVPKGSELINSSSHTDGQSVLFTDYSWLGGARVNEAESNLATVYENFLVLEPGETLTTSLTYRLPEHLSKRLIQSQYYALMVNKQPGTEADDLHITIKLPPNVNIEDVSPPFGSNNGNEVQFETDLKTDRLIEVMYSD